MNVNEQYDATVFGYNDFGLLAKVNDNNLVGLILISQLIRDGIKPTNSPQSIIKTKFKIGTPVKIAIIRADNEKSYYDMKLVT